MEVPLLYEIVIIFLLSIVVTIICNKLKLPATVGFLLTGVLCGPSLLGIVSDRDAIDQVAQIGVAMLLFTIGMELSGEALNRLKRPVFLGGSLQIGLTVLAVTSLALLEGGAWQKCVFWGCLVALSSSAIVLRIMQEHGTTNTPTGRLSLAILVFQDIMVAPMLLCVPLLSGTLELSLENMFFSILWVVLVLGGVLLFCPFRPQQTHGSRGAHPHPRDSPADHSGTVHGHGPVDQRSGPFALTGSLSGGLAVGPLSIQHECHFRHSAYRDVFMSLFFISVGMMLNVNFFGHHFFLIIFNTILFIVIKSLLTLPAVLVQGYPLRAAIITSLSLAQVGEFSFVLAASGLTAGLFDMEAYQNFLDVSVLTMMLTPGLMAVAPRLADLVAGWRNGKQLEREEEKEETPACPLEDHLIIIGFGISGKHLAHVARESGIPYTILEMNPETVTRYKGKEPIAHGDASQPVVLEHLGVEKARVLAIIISDPAAVRAITIEARRFNPNLYIVARTRFVTEVAPLRRLGPTT